MESVQSAVLAVKAIQCAAVVFKDSFWYKVNANSVSIIVVHAINCCGTLAGPVQ